jgi:HMG (high mobility group) box
VVSFGRLSPSSLITLLPAVMAGPVRTAPRTRPAGDQPPRPPNAWILYRSDRVREMPPPLPGQMRTQADVSRAISEQWKNESEVTRAEYERRAEMKKAEHHAQFPDYRFQPKSKEQKERQRLEKKQEKERRPKRSRARVAAPPMAQVPSTQPLPHPAFNSLYNPSYYAEARFGPAGPSPPLSAAASPSENNSCLEQGDELQMPSPNHASPYPDRSHALSPLTVPPSSCDTNPTTSHSQTDPSLSKTPPFHPDPNQWAQLVDAPPPSSSSSNVMTPPVSLWDSYSTPQTLANDLTSSVCCL